MNAQPPSLRRPEMDRRRAWWKGSATVGLTEPVFAPWRQVGAKPDFEYSPSLAMSMPHAACIRTPSAT